MIVSIMIFDLITHCLELEDVIIYFII